MLKALAKNPLKSRQVNANFHGHFPRGNLLVLNAHFLPVTDNLLFLNEGKR